MYAGRDSPVVGYGALTPFLRSPDTVTLLVSVFRLSSGLLEEKIEIVQWLGNLLLISPISPAGLITKRLNPLCGKNSPVVVYPALMTSPRV